jgi:hypothetical protein
MVHWWVLVYSGRVFNMSPLLMFINQWAFCFSKCLTLAKEKIPLDMVPSMYTRNFLPVLYVCFNLMIMIALCLTMVVPMGWEITYSGVELNYHHVLGPLFWGLPPPMGFTYTYGPLWKALMKLLLCNCFQHVSLSQVLKWVPKCHVVCLLKFDNLVLQALIVPSSVG